MWSGICKQTQATSLSQCRSSSGCISCKLTGSPNMIKAATGIITVLRAAPRPEALSHQLNSLVLLTATLYLLHTLRRPNKAVMAAILRYRSVNVLKKPPN